MAEPDAVPQKSRAGRIAGPKKCPHPLTLDAIEETDEEFRIGAMAALRQMETHAGLDAYSCGAIKAAFQDIVGVQFRNGATPGGSLWRRMGFSDIVTAFLAMDSYVELHEGGIVPLEWFVNMPYDKDILVRLIVKKRAGAFAYRAVRKQRTDLLTLNCMAAKLGDEYRVTMGARPARAVLLLDDVPALSCSTLAARADGCSVYTLEGLQAEASEFVGFIADQGTEQCGFCNPGFVMNTIALLRENPDPTDDEILAYLSGNLCRCSDYVGQLRGIRAFLDEKHCKEVERG